MEQYCDPCQKQFSSWSSFEEHNRGPGHEKTVQNHLKIQDMAHSLNSLPQVNEDGPEGLDEFMTTDDQNVYFCSLCKQTCSGKIPAFAHVRGKTHQKKLQQQKFDKGCPPHGFVSDITSEALDSSPTGGTSEMKDSELQIFKRNLLTGHLHCLICQTSVSGEVPALQHVRGKAHIKRARITKLQGGDLASAFNNLTLSSPRLGSDGATSSKAESNGNSSSNQQPSSITNTGRAVPESNISTDHTDGGQESNLTGERDISSSEMEYPELQIFQRIPVTGHLFCPVCQISVSGEAPAIQHVRGKAHIKRARITTCQSDDAVSAFNNLAVPLKDDVHGDEDTQDNGHTLPAGIVHGESVGIYNCKVCGIYVTGEAPLEQHLVGKSHLKKMMIWKLQHSPSSGSDLDSDSQHQGKLIKEESGGGTLDTSSIKQEESMHSLQRDTLDPISSTAVGSHESSDNQQAELAKYWGDKFSYSSPTPQHPNPQQTPISQKTSAGAHSPVIAGNQPMADFLNHQKVSSESPHMHRFWSIPSNHQNPVQPEDNNNDVPRQPIMAPIGTPSPIMEPQAPTSLILDLGAQTDDWRKIFKPNHGTNQLTCDICKITVTGEESAASHVKGTKHAKKLKALQFQLYHMNSQTTSPPGPPPQEQDRSDSFEVLASSECPSHSFVVRGPPTTNSLRMDSAPHTLRGVSMYTDLHIAPKNSQESITGTKEQHSS